MRYRRNGELIEGVSFGRPRAAEPSPARRPAVERLTAYLEQHAAAGLTAAQMAHDLGASEDAARGVLLALVSKGVLVQLPHGVYRTSPGLARDLYVVPADVLPQDAKKGDRIVTVERRGGSISVMYGTAAADDSGRFEFRVARQQPSGAFQTETGAQRAIAKWLGEGTTVAFRPASRGHFGPARSDAELAAQRQQAEVVHSRGVEAAKSSRYKINDVVVLRGGRRRYVISQVEPRYGDVQTYKLAALSGSEAGSAPSGVREAEIRKDPDQTVVWSGEKGDKLWRNYATTLSMDGHSALVVKPGVGEIKTDPGVDLARRVKAAFPPGAGRAFGATNFYRGVKVSQPRRGVGVVWVTVGSWRKDSELRDKLHWVVDRLNSVGLATHINSIEAYNGRVIVTAEEAPARNAERVWAELSKVSENAETRGNPRRRNGGLYPYFSPGYEEELLRREEARRLRQDRKKKGAQKRETRARRSAR
jgi:hypothetical protein